eukprot:363301-Chlamydomonas_euryale.AAC.10
MQCAPARRAPRSLTTSNCMNAGSPRTTNVPPHLCACLPAKHKASTYLQRNECGRVARAAKVICPPAVKLRKRA